MAAHFRKYTLWSYATGDAPGCIHNDIGHLTKGIIYVTFPKGMLKPIQVTATITSGTKIHIDTKAEVTANNMKVNYLGTVPGGQHAYQFTSQDNTTGVMYVEAEALIQASDSAYNPLDIAMFSCYSSSVGSLTIPTNGFRNILKDNVTNDWVNPNVWIDSTSKALKFAPMNADRLLFLSLQGDITLTTQDPCEWHFQLRPPKGDGSADSTVYMSVPTYRISGAVNMKDRQVNIMAYIQSGSDNIFTDAGVVPCVLNTTGANITMQNLELHVYTVAQPRFA